MAAAGLGNMVSDWGGIGLQGIIEQKLAGKARPALFPQCHLAHACKSVMLPMEVGCRVLCVGVRFFLGCALLFGCL
jgi:hypothetical protein